MQSQRWKKKSARTCRITSVAVGITTRLRRMLIGLWSKRKKTVVRVLSDLEVVHTHFWMKTMVRLLLSRTNQIQSRC